MAIEQGSPRQEGQLTQVQTSAKWNPKWREQSACLGTVTRGQDIFFDAQKGFKDRAIAICSTCPVNDHCLVTALTGNIDKGIYGGLEQSERQKLKQRVGAEIYAGVPFEISATSGTQKVIFEGYMKSKAVNEALDSLKKSSQKAESEKTPIPKEVAVETKGRTVRAEQIRRSAIKKLLVYKMWRNGAPTTEIAAITGYREKSVWNILSKARKKNKSIKRRINVSENVTKRRVTVEKLLKGGSTFRQVAKSMGVSPRTIVRDAEAIGFKSDKVEKNKQTKKVRQEHVKALKEEGSTNLEISTELGIHPWSVGNDVREIKGLPKGSRKRQKNRIMRRRQTIRDLREAGQNASQIADSLGFSKRTVLRDYAELKKEDARSGALSSGVITDPYDLESRNTLSQSNRVEGRRHVGIVEIGQNDEL